jgi:hypothetical protein
MESKPETEQRYRQSQPDGAAVRKQSTGIAIPGRFFGENKKRTEKIDQGKLFRQRIYHSARRKNSPVYHEVITSSK